MSETSDMSEGATTPTSFRTTAELVKEKAEATETTSYLKGWRLHFLSLRSAPQHSSFSDCQADDDCSVALLFFLVNIEVSIVGTSLISITDDLHSFKQGGWVVTGYLITYTSKSLHH